MSIKDRLIDRFFGRRIQADAERLVAERLPAAVESTVTERLPAAVETRVQETLPALVEAAVAERLPAAGIAVNPDTQWRRLTGNSNRILPLATWFRQVEVCYWLWRTNPLGNWIVETINAFVSGKGFSFSAENEDVKQILDDLWKSLEFKEKTRELSIFGLQCWPVFKGEQTGRVELGMVDPAQIRWVYTDPQNAMVQIGVRISSLDTGQTRHLRTILPKDKEELLSQDAKQLREGFTDGDCFLFSINRVSNDPYGSSDMFVLADWLDEYEDFMYSYAGKARKQNAYLWDITMEGATEEQCQEYANSNAITGDGATRVHNEKVKWEAVAPKLQALEIKEAASVIRNHILGNKSIPEHWYGGGGDVNRNTASESNEPFFALVDDRQELAVKILNQVFTYAIQCALDAGYLRVPEDEAYSFTISKPEASNKDLTKISTAVRDIVTAMVSAATQGWLDKETSVKMFAFVVALIGFEIDPENILETDPDYQDYTDPKATEKKNAKNAPSDGSGS